MGVSVGSSCVSGQSCCSELQWSASSRVHFKFLSSWEAKIRREISMPYAERITLSSSISRESYEDNHEKQLQLIVDAIKEGHDISPTGVVWVRVSCQVPLEVGRDYG